MLGLSEFTELLCPAGYRAHEKAAWVPCINAIAAEFAHCKVKERQDSYSNLFVITVMF